MAFRTPHQRRTRAAALERTAKELGLEFSEKDEWGLRALLRDFELFQKGGRRRITNMMSKTTGLLEEKINICDYQYTISTGKSSSTYYQTVFFIQSKELGLPEMLIYPEHFFHKIGSWLGIQQDIDFEQWPEFSKKFLVQGDDWGVRRLMNEELTKFFLVERHWCVESLGYYLVFYRRRALVKPASIKLLYQKGMSLFENLKNNDWHLPDTTNGK